MYSIDKTIILDEENPLKKVDVQNRSVPIENDMGAYIFNCSQSLSLVSSAIDKTKLSILLLENSYKIRPEVEGFTPDEFIEYAIENYFIRSGAIYDRCLIFTNSLHELGIANESIGHSLIVTNSHVVKSGLEKKLKSLRKICTEHRVERNKIVHHGRYSEESFNIISAMHKVHGYQKILGNDLDFDQEFLNDFTHEIVDIQAGEFKEHLAKVEAKIAEFFELAEKVYLETKEKHRQKI